jgi:hypothetical protein
MTEVNHFAGDRRYDEPRAPWSWARGTETETETAMAYPDPTGSGQNRTATHAGTLAAIETAGWRLKHVGYIFMITGESSADRLLGTGQNTAASGETVGIYLFRNSDMVSAG